MYRKLIPFLAAPNLSVKKINLLEILLISDIKGLINNINLKQIFKIHKLISFNI
ncbi:hypothetical protein FDC06_06125 [Clostridium botulinum]|uniref:Uncharacterized protein n=2 Tax=Clostridium botulinum TaxID=1491 RepID=A5HZZ2_CLOBH|nr:hypothetical protein CLB_0841 [Clostridium botulinum A str. ATCC 19397]ABS37446.1 hypothetical protein CLC_0855 [Clostridium botulinum A str. Hall]AWB16721.1 hypothetical protein DB732_04410 [Clostridium botulinum]CAL82353.1 hypothetical protein CBO0799 [Clostridium botulinum A str. ATCC 3502]AWB29534.1 hypothetical protein DBN47_04430 [Clostridium botulinum]